jgi:hypothetical protein
MSSTDTPRPAPRPARKGGAPASTSAQAAAPKTPRARRSQVNSAGALQPDAIAPGDPSASAAPPDTPASSPEPASLEAWHALVAEAAYLRAERRGFVGGSPEQDWLEAEQEVRSRLEGERR